MNAHVYCRNVAERILDSFPSGKIEELLKLATRAKQDPAIIGNHKRVLLPEGWEYALYGNCIIARYQDGEQERETFFLPQIWIEFQLADTIEAKKSVEQRLALGYCSCGKSMPLARAILWATDQINHKGVFRLFFKSIGYTVHTLLGLWVLVRPMHRYSLMFNRHPDCL